MKLMYPFPLHFLKYMNTTSHLVLYQLKSQSIHNHLEFLNVNKCCCSRVESFYPKQDPSFNSSSVLQG